jgi:hypothetical protein
MCSINGGIETMKALSSYSRLALWTGLLLLALLFSLAPQAWAAPPSQAGVQPDDLTLDALAGFDGLCKDQRFIPVRVTVANRGPALRGEVLISAPSYASNSTLYTYPLELASTARKELRLAIYPEMYLTSLDVRLRVDGEIVLAQKTPVRCLGADQILVGVLAGNPSALNSLAEYPAGNRDANFARLDPADIPEHARYLEALDVLLVSDLDTGTLRPAQVKALAGWLASGGQLLAMGGPGWQKTAAGLQDLLPFQPDGLGEVADLSRLAEYAGVEAAPSGAALAATGALAEDARLLLSAGGQPLAASRSLGYGRVLYLAFDLASEPLRSWPGAPPLLNALLEPAPAPPIWASGFSDPYQAASAVKTLPSLNLVGIGWLLAFLALYTLCIGPLNYIFLRLIKRRALAWVTIPALTILFTVAAFTLGGRSRGSLPVLSRLSFVQVWPDAAEARLDGMVGIFSPTRRSYALELAPGLSLYPLGDSSLQPPSGGYRLTIGEDGSLSMPSVRMDVAGVLGQAVGGMLPAPRLDQALTLTLDSASARLEGKIVNTAGVRLENLVLLTPGWSQALGDLEPGGELRLDVDLTSAVSSSASFVPAGAGASVYPTASFVPAGAYVYPTGSYTLETLVGGSNYYADSELFRRFSLVSGIAGYNADLSQAGGFSLAAWSSQAAFDASLDTPFAVDDLTLYLFALQPELASTAESLSLPPAFFRWSYPPGSPYYGSERSPYSGYLDGSEPFFFDYQLVQPVHYDAVSGLTLHLQGARLDGGDNSRVRLEVSLWDFTRSGWTALDALPLGDHAIATPQRYVGPGGAIRMRLAHPDDLVPVQLQGVDFSLQVQRSAP